MSLLFSFNEAIYDVCSYGSRRAGERNRDGTAQRGNVVANNADEVFLGVYRRTTEMEFCLGREGNLWT